MKVTDYMDMLLTFNGPLAAAEVHEIHGATFAVGLESATQQAEDHSMIVSGADLQAMRRLLWFVMVQQNRQSGTGLVGVECNYRMEENEPEPRTPARVLRTRPRTGCHTEQ